MFGLFKKKAVKATPREEPKEGGVEKEKEISEPVYSFVETVKRDRKRFIFESKSVGPYGFAAGIHSCYDTYTDTLFRISNWFGFCENTRFLTEDECKYMREEIEGYFQQLEARKENIKTIRKRRELCDVYCK